MPNWLLKWTILRRDYWQSFPLRKTYSVTCTASSQSATLVKEFNSTDSDWSCATRQDLFSTSYFSRNLSRRVRKPIGPLASTDLKYGWYIDTSKGAASPHAKSSIRAIFWVATTAQKLAKMDTAIALADCDNQMGPFKCSPSLRNLRYNYRYQQHTYCCWR